MLRIVFFIFIEYLFFVREIISYFGLILSLYVFYFFRKYFYLINFLVLFSYNIDIII